MPEIVEIFVYRLDELSAPARERARAWGRAQLLDPDWHESVFDDFEAICAILGVSLGTTLVPLMGGCTRPRPRIYFPRATARRSRGISPIAGAPHP